MCTANPPVPHPYQSELFVLPEELLATLHAKAVRWMQTSRPDWALTLIGERGSGKTWLLRYLEENAPIFSCPAIYLDLSEREKYQNAESYIRAVENHPALCTDHSTGVVFLLDHMPSPMQKPDEKLQALGLSIWQVFSTHRVAVIAALTNPYRVYFPSLQSAEQCSLSALDEAMTDQQIACFQQSGLLKVTYPDSRSLLQDSKGIPMLNYLLSTLERREAFSQFLAYCAADIPFEDRTTVQEYLTMVCVLPELDNASIRTMMEIYANHCSSEINCPPFKLRNLLIFYGLATDRFGKCIINESVRYAAQEVLKADNPTLYNALHEKTHH